ncbi:DNA-binding protein, partial [Staphylococcus pasteuri]
MSNQYYNFLNKELITYFENTDVKPGNRYFLILNNEEELQKLKNSITLSSIHTSHVFKSKEYNYETNYYDIKGKKFIFIFANEGITHDFLVTIRNKVSLQENEWKDSVAIFIIKEDLDSITGGSFDLSKQGAPFHTYSLRNNLIKILQSGNNKLSEHETQILKFIVSKNFEDELTKYTLMDFESVYSIIEQEKITNVDYFNLGIFNDKQLETFKESEINERLKENRQLFESVQSIHDRGNVREQLQELFDEKIASKLEKNNWYEIDFEVVKKSKELMDIHKKVKIDFLEDDFKHQFKRIEVWDKPSGKSKSKARERNIIIFKEKNLLNQIIIPFSKNININ